MLVIDNASSEGLASIKMDHSDLTDGKTDVSMIRSEHKLTLANNGLEHGFGIIA
jgi:hypothetical protein